MDAKEVASKRASEKAGERVSEEVSERVKESKRPTIPGMTTYQDLMERYKTNVVRTPSGLTFLIQTVNPGDYMSIAGTPLLKYWSDKGIDFSDNEARLKSIDAMTDEQKTELTLDDNFQDMVRSVVCAGVYSLNLVNKRQAQCDSSKEELSVDLIPMADLFVLFTEIISLSQGEEFSAELELFREQIENGESQGLADQDSRHSEGIQPAPEFDTVSEDS